MNPGVNGRSAVPRAGDGHRSLFHRTTSGKIPMEGSHEQRTSEYASGRRSAAAYPPYDPKTQWRVYREQQKAAWRAQRDAWKAQRYAMEGGLRRAHTVRGFLRLLARSC